MAVGTIFFINRKGQEMQENQAEKRVYERPEMQRLGLLRDLTKFSGNWNFPY